jgi:hypothetical protein
MRFLLPLLFLASAALADDDAITIKLKLHPEPGRTVTTDGRHVDRGSTRIEGADGKLLAEVKPGGSETVETTTVLEADKDGVPTRYLRTYEKAAETENSKTKTFTYQGRTLLYEKGKDGKVRVGVSGARGLDPKDAEKLVERAKKPSESEALMRQFAPKKPVKVGDSWPLDIKLVAAAMEVKADEARSAATVKLTKVERRSGTPVGTFELDVRLALAGTAAKYDITFDPPGSLTMKGAVELAIDGSSTESKADLDMGLTGSGTVKGRGKITFDVSGKVTEHQSAERPAREAKAPTVTWLRSPGEWAPFKPKDGSFAVELPGAAKEDRRKNGRGDNTVTWTVEADGGAVAYVVGVTDFVGDATKADPKAVLTAVANGQKGARDVKDVKIDGHPGIEFHRSDTIADKEMEFRQRVVIVNGRMLQQIVIAEKGKGKPADADKFSQSFKILVKPIPKDD